MTFNLIVMRNSTAFISARIAAFSAISRCSDLRKSALASTRAAIIAAIISALVVLGQTVDISLGGDFGGACSELKPTDYRRHASFMVSMATKSDILNVLYT